MFARAAAVVGVLCGSLAFSAASASASTVKGGQLPVHVTVTKSVLPVSVTTWSTDINLICDVDANAADNLVGCSDPGTQTATNADGVVDWFVVPNFHYLLTESVADGWVSGEFDCTSSSLGDSIGGSLGGSLGGALTDSAFTLDLLGQTNTNVTCSIVNYAPIKLTVTKEVFPLSTPDWSYGFTVTCAADQIVPGCVDPAADTTDTATKAEPVVTWTLNPPYQYVITEDTTPDDSGSWLGFECAPAIVTGPSRSAHVVGAPPEPTKNPSTTINVNPAEVLEHADINCTIRNVTNSRLFLQKQTDEPGGPFKFGVEVGGQLIETPIITTSASGVPTPEIPTEIELPYPGDLKVTELQGPANYYQRFQECLVFDEADQTFVDAGTPELATPTPIDLTSAAFVPLGMEVECLFENDVYPTLSITKTVIPASNTTWITKFQIEPAPPGGQPQTKVATAAAPTVAWTVDPFTTYTITEIAPGFTLGTFFCTDEADSQGGSLGSSIGGFEGDGIGILDMSLHTGDVDCTIQNISPPVVNIYKWTLGKPGGPFTFDIVEDGQPVGSAQITTFTANQGFPGFDPDTAGVASFVLPHPGTVDLTTGVLENQNSMPADYVSLTPGFPGQPVFECTVTRFDDANLPPVNMPDTAPLRNGDELNCPFLNIKLPTITVTKKVLPADYGDWNFDILATGDNAPVAAVTLVGHVSNDDPTTTIILPNPGSWDLSEVVPPGWEAGPFECTNSAGQTIFINSLAGSLGGSLGGSMTTLNVGFGDDWTCTITNLAPPKIQVAKTTNGGVGTFTFNVDSTNDPVTLSQDITTTVDGEQVQGTDTEVFAGDVTVSENPVDGWYPSSASTCVVYGTDGLPTLPAYFDEDRNGSITVPGVTAGERVSCSFINDAAASISVTKSFLPASVAVWSADFTLTDSEGGTYDLVSTDQDNDTATWLDLDPTLDYTIAESNVLPANGQLGTVTCQYPGAVLNNAKKGSALVSVNAGQTLGCDVTNLAPPRVILSKISIGGTGSFGFLVTNGVNVTYKDPNTTENPVVTTDTDGTVDPLTDVVVPVTPGTVYVRENTLPAGWTFKSLTCFKVNAAGTQLASQTVNVFTTTLNTILGYGEEFHCTATNAAKASVTVHKSVLPAGTTPWTASFKISPIPTGETATKVATNVTPDVTWTNLTPGTKYTITETAPNGFTPQSFECVAPNTSLGGGLYSGPASFTPAEGEAWSCDAVNVAPPKVFIQKVTLGGAGGPFTIKLADGNGAKPNTVIGTQAPETATPANPVGVVVKPGTVTVSEPTVPTGWRRFDIVCSVVDKDGQPVDTFGSMGGPSLPLTLAAGDVASCVVTNQKLATASVTKTVQGPTPWSFKFTISPVPAGETATKTATNAAATVSWNNLNPDQQYTITEEVKPGYQNDPMECSGANGLIPGPGRRVAGGGSIGGGLPSASFVPASGDAVTCAIINQAQSKLVVTKTVTPVTTDNWSFVVEVRDHLGDLVGKRTLTKAQPSATFDGLDPDEVYSVAELPSTNPRFSTGGILCSNVLELLDVRPATSVFDGDATEGVSFQIPAGATATCAIDNVRNETDIELTKTTTATVVGLGTTVDWTIHIKNNGPSPAENIVLNDIMPAALTLVSVTPAPGWDCSSSDIPGGVVNCTKALFVVGEEADFIVTTTVNAAIAGDPIVNLATVTTDTDETTTVNNSDNAQVTVEDLPATGADTGRFLVFGAALLMMGLFLLGSTRRRKTLIG